MNAEVQERFGLRRFAVRGVSKVRGVTEWTVLAFTRLHFAQQW